MFRKDRKIDRHKENAWRWQQSAWAENQGVWLPLIGVFTRGIAPLFRPPLSLLGNPMWRHG
jgi:hypothetical protein